MVPREPARSWAARVARPSMSVSNRGSGIRGDSEVGQVSVPLLVEQDVLELQAAVNDTELVCHRQWSCDLVDDLHHSIRSERSSGQEVPQVTAGDELLHEERCVRLAPEVVERHHMIGLEPGNQRWLLPRISE